MLLKLILKRQLVFLFLLITIASFVFNACRKYDTDKSSNKQALIDRFFKIPEKASPQLITVINSVKLENEQHDFIEYFIDKNGWPRWQDAEIVGEQKMIARIPFVKDNEQEVNGFFNVKINIETGNSYFELYRKDLYKVYGFNSQAKGMNAYKVQMIINTINQHLYHIDTFRFYDRMEVPLDLSNKYGSNKDWDNTTFKTIPSASDISAAQSGDNYKSELFCITTTYCFSERSYGDCATCMNVPYCYSDSYCWESGGGGNEGGNSDPPHGGGGGGGNGTPPNDPPWWQGGDDGNCRCAPPPPPNNDSIVLVKLKSENELVQRKRDEAWDSAISKKIEYGFYLGMTGSNNKEIVDWHTSGLPDEIYDNKRLLRGYTLLAHWHTHEDSTPLLRHPQDPFDLLTNSINSSMQNFTTYVDCGDTLYAVVNENLTLVKNFFRTHNMDDAQGDFGAYLLYGGQGRRRIGLQKLIALLGSSGTSGLGFYKSTNPAKTTFIKVN